ncbi:MAG TPA: histidinol dehydrogenase, partial [Hyphomonadaceae bacterium]|nr:histidinol dehydrogenase [Hyphomonadaceae bacterium]
MARRFNSSDSSFEADFGAFLKEPRGNAQDTRDTVREILDAVETRGGKAVAEYTSRFDR